AARHADRVVGLRAGRVVLDCAPDQSVDSLYQVLEPV
ncbi:MAG: phosphonate ABC transporter, partial [Saccharothrix sp.]|nr:phosphonate ABC transporter [Saccharothrix sp.]